jgi:mRNA interferase MazF
VEQGDVVWVEFGLPRGSEPAGRRPAVVLQHDRFNRSALRTLVVVSLTSRLTYAALPGNVRLAAGEAGLPRASVANVTQISTVDRDRIIGRIGRVSAARLDQIWSGVRLVLEPPPRNPSRRGGAASGA